MGAVKTAIGDAVITFLWVFCSSTLGALTSVVASALDIHGQGPTLAITVLILTFLLLIFTALGEMLGGATFNPTGSASFYAAGVGGDTLSSLALRLPAQTAGAVAGAAAIMEYMPLQYKHMLGGPALKVDLQTGAIAEGVLTFLMTFLVLYIILRGPKNTLLQIFLLAISTMTLVITGSTYTGPSMNPANAFGWAYVYNRHNTWEQFYVYWICPFVGAILAAWVFRYLCPPPAIGKQKKA
ncbi:aquaporin SIP1-2 [Aristolochia californica]|uniref:aquaporin SIP1-2 n=1 Tax=Aristolochia californica TaxID=171875 RepID=UPI0035D5FA1E